MSFAEKDPKDASKDKSQPPKLDAILPDNLPPSAAELVDDISTYQRRMEKEWEAAKGQYEQKINRIMDEFVTDGMAKLAADPPPSREPASSSARRDPGDAKLQDLIHQLEKELHGAPRSQTPSSPHEFFSHAEPAALPLGWRRPRLVFSRALKFTGMASLLLLLVGSAFWVFQWRVIQTPIPYAHTLGPVIFNKHLYIMDWFRKMLFVHKNDSALTILSVEALPNSLATGFAMSDKVLWSLDSLDLKLNLHSTTVDHQVTNSFATPETRPAGMFFDGTDLWTADQDIYKLYRHRGNDVEEIRDTFPLPDVTITSFFLHNKQLWLLDGKSRLLTVYRLQKPLLKLASYDLDPLLKQAAATGMAMDGNTLLVVTENPASLLRIPRYRLKHSRLRTSV